MHNHLAQKIEDLYFKSTHRKQKGGVIHSHSNEIVLNIISFLMTIQNETQTKNKIDIELLVLKLHTLKKLRHILLNDTYLKRGTLAKYQDVLNNLQDICINYKMDPNAKVSIIIGTMMLMVYFNDQSNTSQVCSDLKIKNEFMQYLVKFSKSFPKEINNNIALGLSYYTYAQSLINYFNNLKTKQISSIQENYEEIIQDLSTKCSNHDGQLHFIAAADYILMAKAVHANIDWVSQSILIQTIVNHHEMEKMNYLAKENLIKFLKNAYNQSTDPNLKNLLSENLLKILERETLSRYTPPSSQNANKTRNQLIDIKSLKTLNLSCLIHHFKGNTKNDKLDQYMHDLRFNLHKAFIRLKFEKSDKVEERIEYMCNLINLLTTHDQIISQLDTPNGAESKQAPTPSYKEKIREKIDELITACLKHDEVKEIIERSLKINKTMHYNISYNSEFNEVISTHKRKLFNDIFLYSKALRQEDISELLNNELFEPVSTCMRSHSKYRLQHFNPRKDKEYRFLEDIIMELKFISIYPTPHKDSYPEISEKLKIFVEAYSTTQDEEVIAKLFLFLHHLYELCSCYTNTSLFPKILHSHSQFLLDAIKEADQKIENKTHTSFTSLIILIGTTFGSKGTFTVRTIADDIGDRCEISLQKLSPEHISSALSQTKPLSGSSYTDFNIANTLLSQLIYMYSNAATNRNNEQERSTKRFLQLFKETKAISSADKLAQIQLLLTPIKPSSCDGKQIQSIISFLNDFTSLSSQELTQKEKIGLIHSLPDYIIGINEITSTLNQIIPHLNDQSARLQLQNAANKFIRNGTKIITKISNIIREISRSSKYKNDDFLFIYWAIYRISNAYYMQNTQLPWKNYNTKFELPLFIWRDLFTLANSLLNDENISFPTIKPLIRIIFLPLALDRIRYFKKNTFAHSIYMSEEGLLALSNEGLAAVPNQPQLFCIWACQTKNVKPSLPTQLNLSLDNFMYLDHEKEAKYNKDMQCSKKYLLLYNIQYAPNLSRLEILQLIHEILSLKEYELLGQINISDPLCDLILADGSGDSPETWKNYFKSTPLSTSETTILHKIADLYAITQLTKNRNNILLHQEVAPPPKKEAQLNIFKFIKGESIMLPLDKTLRLLSATFNISAHKKNKAPFYIWANISIESLSKPTKEKFKNIYNQMSKLSKANTHKNLLEDATITINRLKGIEIIYPYLLKPIILDPKKKIVAQIHSVLSVYLNKFDIQSVTPNDEFKSTLTAYLRICAKLSLTPFNIQQSCTSHSAKIMLVLINQNDVENDFKITDILKAYEMLLRIDQFKNNPKFCQLYQNYLNKMWEKTKQQQHISEHILISQLLKVTPLSHDAIEQDSIYDLMTGLIISKNLDIELIIANPTLTNQVLEIIQDNHIKISEKAQTLIEENRVKTQDNDFLNHLHLSSFLKILPFKKEASDEWGFCQQLLSYISDEKVVDLSNLNALDEGYIYHVLVKMHSQVKIDKSAHLQYIFTHSLEKNRYHDHLMAARSLCYVPFSDADNCKFPKIYQALDTENYQLLHSSEIKVHLLMSKIIKKLDNPKLTAQMEGFLQKSYHKSKENISKHLQWCKIMGWQPYEARPLKAHQNNPQTNKLLAILDNPKAFDKVSQKFLQIILCQEPSKFESKWLQHFLIYPTTTIDIQNPTLKLSIHDHNKTLLIPRAYDHLGNLIHQIQINEKGLIQRHLQHRISENYKDSYKIALNNHLSVSIDKYCILNLPVEELSKIDIEKRIFSAIDSHQHQDINKVIDILPHLTAQNKKTLLKLKMITSRQNSRWYIGGGLSYLIKSNTTWADHLMPKKLLLGFDGTLDEIKIALGDLKTNYHSTDSLVIILDEFKIVIKENIKSNTPAQGFSWCKLNDTTQKMQNFHINYPDDLHSASGTVLKALKYYLRGVLKADSFEIFLSNWKKQFHTLPRSNHAALCLDMLRIFKHIDFDLLSQSLQYMLKLPYPNHSELVNQCIRLTIDLTRSPHPFKIIDFQNGILEEYSKFQTNDTPASLIEHWEESGLLTNYSSEQHEMKEKFSENGSRSMTHGKR